MYQLTTTYKDSY